MMKTLFLEKRTRRDGEVTRPSVGAFLGTLGASEGSTLTRICSYLVLTLEAFVSIRVPSFTALHRTSPPISTISVGVSVSVICSHRKEIVRNQSSLADRLWSHRFQPAFLRKGRFIIPRRNSTWSDLVTDSIHSIPRIAILLFHTPGTSIWTRNDFNPFQRRLPRSGRVGQSSQPVFFLLPKVGPGLGMNVMRIKVRPESLEVGSEQCVGLIA
jgi:hypothetical protein